MLFSITVPLQSVLPSAANESRHFHTKTQRASKFRTIGRVAVLSNAPGPFNLPCVVTLTRIAPRALDDDNLAYAFKAVRDGVADALGIRDNDKRVAWKYEQQKGKAAIAIQIAEARK